MLDAILLKRPTEDDVEDEEEEEFEVEFVRERDELEEGEDGAVRREEGVEGEAGEGEEDEDEPAWCAEGVSGIVSTTSGRTDGSCRGVCGTEVRRKRWRRRGCTGMTR